MSDVINFPQLSESLCTFCESSEDPMVGAAPQLITSFLELEQKLPPKYGWRFSDEASFDKQVVGLKSPSGFNRVYWTDQARNVEAYSTMSMWRGSELIKPAIRSLNIGELITPAVLARSLLELSTACLLHANNIEKHFMELEFPPNTVVVSQEFEESVVKMIWGTRLGKPEKHLQQTNVLTLISKLAKNPNAADLLPHYEFLCEIAHPNVVGNSRFWSHLEQMNEDGSESRTLTRTADGDHAAEIRTKVLWSLAWSAGSLVGAFNLIRNGLNALLSKLDSADRAQGQSPGWRR